MNFAFKLGPLNISLGKSLSPTLTNWLRGGGDEDSGAGARLQTPYAQSSWAYIAITRLAEKVAQIPFRISQVSGGEARKVRALRSSADPAKLRFVRKALNEEIVSSGDVVDLFHRPHVTMGAQLFWETLVTWWAMRGEFFVLPVDGADSPVNLSDRGAQPEGLVVLTPDMFWHIIDGYTLMGWRYTGSPLLTPVPSQFLLPEEVIHARKPNPYLYWRGMSPLTVASVATQADYAAAQYSKGYWLNNADTGVIVTTEQQVDPAQKDAILQSLNERKRKAGTPDRPLFLWGGAKVEKPQLSGMETQFIENRKMNRQEIAAIFKVPDSVMGFSEAKASALSGGGNAMEQDMIAFIENAIAPLCCQIEDAFAPVVSSFDESYVGWFDLESLPVMQSARRARLASATTAFGLGAAFNDINEQYDLGFPQYKYGKRNFLPFNLTDVTDPDAEAEPPAEDAPPAPGEKPATDADEQKRLSFLMGKVSLLCAPPGDQRKLDTIKLWQSHVAARNKSVRVFKKKVGAVLMSYRAKTITKLEAAHREKTVQTRSLVDLIFNANEFGDSLLGALTASITHTLQTAGDELNDEIGVDDPWQMAPEQAKDYLAARQVLIQGVGGTVRDQLNTSLQAGVDAGETTAQLAQRVKAVFTKLSDNEAERVARTEVNGAYNFARHGAMVDAGIEYKSWLSSHGPNVRIAHAEAEMDYIDDPIPVDDPFEVGGEQLMYPGDDSLGASPGNVINCQCVQLAAQKKDEDEKSLTYLVFGFGALTIKKL